MATGSDIMGAARSQIGSLGYKKNGYSNATPSGVPKDHHFVADTLNRAGLGIEGSMTSRPGADDWANPAAHIPGWPVVTDGSIREGDVLATVKPIPLDWYRGGGQQLGIATANGTSIGVTDNNRVGESGFGFRDGDNPTVRRAEQFASASEAASGTAKDGYNDFTKDVYTGALGAIGGMAGNAVGGPIGGVAGSILGGVAGGYLGTHAQKGDFNFPPAKDNPDDPILNGNNGIPFP